MRRRVVLCTACGAALLAVLMTTDIESGRARAAAPACVTINHKTCAMLFPATACNSSNCTPLAGGGFVCAAAGASQTTPAALFVARCATAKTGARLCDPGALPAVNCGTTDSCSGCAPDATGTQKCQPAGRPVQNNASRDGVKGGSCTTPSG